MLKFDEQMRLSVNSDTEYIYIKLYLKNIIKKIYIGRTNILLRFLTTSTRGQLWRKIKTNNRNTYLRIAYISTSPHLWLAVHDTPDQLWCLVVHSKIWGWDYDWLFLHSWNSFNYFCHPSQVFSLLFTFWKQHLAASL